MYTWDTQLDPRAVAHSAAAHQYGAPAHIVSSIAAGRLVDPTGLPLTAVRAKYLDPFKINSTDLGSIAHHCSQYANIQVFIDGDATWPTMVDPMLFSRWPKSKKIQRIFRDLGLYSLAIVRHASDGPAVHSFLAAHRDSHQILHVDVLRGGTSLTHALAIAIRQMLLNIATGRFVPRAELFQAARLTTAPSDAIAQDVDYTNPGDTNAI